MGRSAGRIVVDVIVAVVFVAAAGGVAWLLSSEPVPTYQATVRLAVAPDPLVAGDDPDAYGRAARSDAVLRGALERMGAVQPDAGQVGSLRDLVTTESRGGWPGSATLHVGVTGPTPEVAEGRAEALVAALMEWDRVEQRLVETIDELETRISSLTTQLRTEQVLGVGSDEGEVEALETQRALAIERRDRAQASLDSDEPSRTLASVGTETTRIATRPARHAAWAAAIAGLASLIVVVRLSRRDRRRASLPRATARLAPRSAGVLASFPRGESEHDPAVRAAADHLRRAVSGHIGQARPSVILLTGVEEHVGVTVVACRLAEELARKGRRTLLVDGSLRSPDVAARYGVDERPPAGQPFASTVDWLQQPGAQHRGVTVRLDGDVPFYVVPQFRPTRPGPGAGEAMFAGLPSALERWAQFDVIVVDSAPITVVEDTRSLAAHATGVVLVVPRGRSDERRLEAVRETLRNDGTPFLGFVENDVPPQPASEPEPAPEPEPRPDQGPAPAARRNDDRDAFARAFGPRDRTRGQRRERRGDDRNDGDR